MNSQFWWYVARASGFVAWGLAMGAVVWGLALSTKALGSRPRAAWLLDLHRYLGGLTVVFVAMHLAALVADSYVYFGWAELFVPFASGWKPLPVALGVLAFWLLVAVEVTSLLMRRLPRRAWRAIHMASYLVAALGTVHAVTAGTDARNPAFTFAVLGSAGALLFFIVYRALAPHRAARSTGRVSASRKSVAARRAPEVRELVASRATRARASAPDESGAVAGR